MTAEEKERRADLVNSIAEEARTAMVETCMAKVREYYDRGDVTDAEAIACHITAASMFYDSMLETSLSHGERPPMKLAGGLYSNIIAPTLRRLRDSLSKGAAND